ncbi:hypothetical protein ACP70R_043995 [Stipagrostis hirtigluma subsp. patula]
MAPAPRTVGRTETLRRSSNSGGASRARDGCGSGFAVPPRDGGAVGFARHRHSRLRLAFVLHGGRRPPHRALGARCFAYKEEAPIRMAESASNQ